MKPSLIKFIQIKAKTLFIFVYQRRGFLIRALICWVFSLFFLKFDENGNYDIRYRLRAAQPTNQNILLITLKNSDFVKIYDQKTSNLINTNEMSDINDSFYWDRHVWKDLLAKLLAAQPKGIGITLFIGDNIGEIKLSPYETEIFKDPKVFWATNSSEPEKISLPLATRHDRSNLAHIDHLKDDDGITRRIIMNSGGIPCLAEVLNQLYSNTTTHPNSENLSLPIINYKGPNPFKEISLSDVLKSKYPNSFYKNKIIVIGSEKSINSQLQTPLGLMSRHAFWAQVTENLLTHSFIERTSTWLYSGFLLFLTVISILIITHYPQSVALFFFIWIGTLTSAFSAWIFDSFYIWIPIISPLSLLIFIWVLFIGYQALKIEQAHAKLKQEQSYLAELEQLKNNFVSLISHDLKTPIAKIQAVLDRLITQSDIPSELQVDLNSLKNYSEELNRYIQSILKVLRVESRDFKILKETADINGIIENAIERLKPLSVSKNIQISTELEPMFLIELDVTLMTEVFLNIIENAIKYTSINGAVKIKSFESETEVCVEISDNGEGISLEDQEQIWKKFVRGKSQDHRTKGTGLGLYLVKYFIELHGGQIHFESQKNKGTTFYIKLPLETE